MLAFRWQSAAQLLAVLQRVPLCNGALFGGEPTVSSKPLLLLTDPAHFEVSYRINPWMQPCAWAEDPAGHLAAAERSFQRWQQRSPLPEPALRSCPALRTCRTWCFPPMRRWCSTAVRWSRDFATPNASAKSSISRNVSGLRWDAIPP